MKLVKAYADWCQPCSALSATLKGVNHELVQNMELLDIDADIKRAQKLGVRSIPTLLIVDSNENVIRSINGNQPKQKLLEFLG